VADLGPLARAILPEDLRGRQWIWPDEANRWNTQAARWASAGFTDRSVLPWLETGLRPRRRRLLAARGVKPDVLFRLVPVPVTVVATGAATVRWLLRLRCFTAYRQRVLCAPGYRTRTGSYLAVVSMICW
jgi:hypothetical protein